MKGGALLQRVRDLLLSNMILNISRRPYNSYGKSIKKIYVT